MTLSMSFLLACVKSNDFDTLKSECEANLIANISYAEVKDLYLDETFQIQEDLIIEGYVTSSDKEGNFFSVIHFQDRAVNPNEGLRIELDLFETNLLFPEGTKILIKLKGLYLGKSKDVYKLGGTFTAFGNISVGRLPAAAVRQHLFISCDDSQLLQPTLLSIQDVQKNLTNTLVKFNNVQIDQEDIDQPYAIEREETERTLVDCNGNELVLLNSGYSDFFEEIMPNGNGTITGVLLRERDDYQLVIRSPEDIDFKNLRCE